MARYRGPVCKLCRREGEKLYVKGDRCFTAKCALSKRAFAPGQHGKLPKKLSDYGLRLREKQKLARFYGILERQFRAYFEEASRKPGVTGTQLLQMLESRLDNFVFRLGMGASRKHSRQLVLHGHFQVNKKNVNIPSYRLKPNDVVTFKKMVGKVFEFAAARTKDRDYPEWIGFDKEKGEGVFKAFPERKQIDVPVNEQMVVEFYSR